MFKIESGIALKRTPGVKSPEHETLIKLEPGESFFVPNEQATINYPYQFCYDHSQNGKVYRVRREKEGFRYHRVS